uniref:Sperm acrosome associated 9 n=1 Tax=Sinocyclocheilus anshuiensis TaxID=1608454 RepID=A0A671NTN7_9TELE
MTDFREQEHARDKTEYVSTVTQVQRYLNLHCSNSTDKRILLLFLEIISDLEGVLKHLESSPSSRSTSSEGLNTCRELLNPYSNISQLRAEINRLSCDEARNSYGGIVSVIPLMVADLDKKTSGWHAGKPALKPPGGHTRK